MYSYPLTDSCQSNIIPACVLPTPTRRWFLSYHSPDRALAERLKAAIERKDEGAIVFFAPTNLRAGGRWAPALAESIAEATAFVLLATDKGIGRWQEIEYDAAFDKHVNTPNFPVVLMLLEGQAAPRLSFLKQLHWIVTPDPASEKDVARLIDAVASGSDAKPGELWRYTSPYRGLSAMEEKDSDYFFGRERETVEVLGVLAAESARLPVLLGNSGVGKSSLAQAGVIAALRRQAWPERADGGTWPAAFKHSRGWCFLTLRPGAEPIKALVETFLRTWQYDATDSEWEERQKGWVDRLLDGRATLRGLLDATERRYEQLFQPKPPAFLLYVDQGEELYVRAQESQHRWFSAVIAQGVADPRLYVLMSMRTDFLGELQKDEPLYKVRRQIDVPPLREAELQEVVSRPAELLSARFETAGLADIITRRTAEDSVKDVGALPLLSYTLDDMWSAMVKRGDGVLRLPAQSFELGGVLVDRADAFLATHPKSKDALRRIFTLKLATVRAGEEPTRRPASRSEFTEEEWRLVTELADHPNRLLVTATPESGETYAEVAHEAIFRRWGKLREWIAVEREFLAWKTELEAARRAWRATPDSSKAEALLMGVALAQGQNWLGKRRDDLPAVDRDFIDQSIKRDGKVRGRARRIRALIYVLLVGIIAGLVGWINQSYLKERWNWYTIMRPYMLAQVRPHVLSPDAERALKPGETFQECAKDCPEMIVVPAGEFVMGSRPNEGAGEPQHRVTITKPFAVSKFDVTFADWDACVSVRGCPQVLDSGFGRGTRPVIHVSWDDAQQYVAWFSKMTGRPYRLLSEAEWEYAARAGTTTAYFWGDDIGKGNANCRGCGSEWIRRTSPVGSFKPNAFGLYDMAGNVAQWVQDCWIIGAPTDGSALSVGNCSIHAIRGGSWGSPPQGLHSFVRAAHAADRRDQFVGFRLGRTLSHDASTPTTHRVGPEVAPGTAQAEVQSGPCAQIRAACEQAGFKFGAAEDGIGLKIDCIRPIMQGVPQRPEANKPLPQVDPHLVAACKSRNPNFGEAQAPTEAPQSSPLPPPEPPQNPPLQPQ
jgi:formylglycine-generating enzyme required for sulfatase activity